MSDNFYRAFEEKYRGPRELIKSRLQVYLPFIQPIFKAYPIGRALDLGCGRGEWLELLTEQGFNAEGVDLDEGMLQACRERGLKVENADAIKYMKASPDNSLCIVSGFHIAEHLEFEVLQQLIMEAKRVLIPGGLLILETPNPENVTVGTSSFYLDPTHHRPIPPELLIFLPEFYGYDRYKILRLQENSELCINQNPKLIQVLNGVSPDYAVVAQTYGNLLLMEELTSVFDKQYGLTLNSLAERFQLAIEQRLDVVESKTVQAATKAYQAENKAAQAQIRAQQAEIKVEQVEIKAQQVKVAAEQIDTIQRQHAAQLDTVFQSTSWRITAPLRWPVQQWRLVRQHGAKSRIKALAKKVLRKLLPYIMTRPSLRSSAIRVAYNFGIAERLKPFVQNTLSSYVEDSSDLSPRAQQIYLDLKAAIAIKQKRDR